MASKKKTAKKAASRKNGNGKKNGRASVKKTSVKRIGTGLPGPGRRKGVPNKVTIEAQKAAAELVDNPDYRKKLLADLIARKVPPQIESMLWHYAKGKPKETVQINSEVTHGLDADSNKALARYAAILTEIARGSADGTSEDVRAGESVDTEDTD